MSYAVFDVFKVCLDNLDLFVHLSCGFLQAYAPSQEPSSRFSQIELSTGSIAPSKGKPSAMTSVPSAVKSMAYTIFPRTHIYFDTTHFIWTQKSIPVASPAMTTISFLPASVSSRCAIGRSRGYVSSHNVLCAGKATVVKTEISDAIDGKKAGDIPKVIEAELPNIDFQRLSPTGFDGQVCDPEIFSTGKRTESEAVTAPSRRSLAELMAVMERDSPLGFEFQRCSPFAFAHCDITNFLPPSTLSSHQLDGREFGKPRWSENHQSKPDTGLFPPPKVSTKNKAIEKHDESEKDGIDNWNGPVEKGKQELV